MAEQDIIDRQQEQQIIEDLFQEPGLSAEDERYLNELQAEHEMKYQASRGVGKRAMGNVEVVGTGNVATKTEIQEARDRGDSLASYDGTGRRS